MENITHPQKNTLLKKAQAHAESNFFKRVFISPPKQEFQNIFSNASKKNKTPVTQTVTTKTLKLSADNGLQGRPRKTPAGNTGLAKVAVQCSADTFVVNQSLVLRINISGENRHLRQARNRCASFYKTTVLNFELI
jgi:hypothetical protein